MPNSKKITSVQGIKAIKVAKTYLHSLGFKMEVTVLNRPTTEQIQALQEYAKANGRTWKSKLNSDWMMARTTGILQQIRNQFGPSWLTKFRLP